MHNSSGQGSGAALPPGVAGWNWGAFLLTFIWGLGNRTYKAFWVFVPFLNLIWPFVLGAKGSTWAWQNREWASVEEFKRTQRHWGWAGLGMIALFVLIGVAVFYLATGLMKQSTAYGMAMERVQRDPALVAALGEPITGGNPAGSVSAGGARDSAELRIPLQGPQGSATAYVRAVENMDVWLIERLEVALDGKNERLVLEPRTVMPAAP